MASSLIESREYVNSKHFFYIFTFLNVIVACLLWNILTELNLSNIYIFGLFIPAFVYIYLVSE
jgi:hypothetical protein